MGSGNGEPLSRGTLRGEPGYEGSLTGNSDSYIRRKEGFRNGAPLSLYRASVKGSWRSSSALRTTRDMKWKAVETEHFFNRAP